MFEWIGSLSGSLEHFFTGISDNIWLTILFVFAIAIGEAVFILGIFVPSTPVLLLSGALIAQGVLPFWEIYLAAVLGAVIGDAISYTVGWWLKDRIKGVWPFRNHLEMIARGEAFFARHGGKSVFIARFIPAVKAVVPGIAGMMGMRYSWFTFINVVSAFVWAGAHILPGMLLTSWLESMDLSPEPIIMIGALVLIVVLVLVHFHRDILLFFAPWLGGFGRFLQARWGKPDTPPTSH